VYTPEEPGSLAALEEAREPPKFSSYHPARPQQKIDPDNPPWGVPMAFLVWFSSLLLLVMVPIVFVLPYAAHRGITPALPDYGRALGDFVLKDPTAVFLQVFSTLPAHLLTVAVVWAVVTGFGKRPFWETLGWSWRGRFGLLFSIALGIVLFVASSALAHFLGGDKQTPLEELLNSSPAARYMIAFLATLTAPFVEEFVFRGVLYSALRRLVGTIGAVIFVVALFTAVHIPQYRTNYGVIAAVALLSLALTVTRALSGRLLPCFVVHLVFNGIQSIIILWQPAGSKPIVPPDHAVSAILSLSRALHFLT
jgi:membrane protease YdiL (CAAX protease family)